MKFNISTVAALAAFTVSVSASATHSWNDYHFARTTSNWTLQVVDSVDGNWQSTFEESLSRWTGGGGLSFNIAAADDSSRARKRCSMVSGQMRVCNAAYGQNGWLGLASINLDSNGHITQGTAKMNDSYSSYWTPEEMNHVMCQEIGHVFGLGHTSEDGSSQNTCMDYSTSSSSQWPNNHDFQMLDEMYAHLDSYNSYSDGSTPTKPCRGKKCANNKGFGLGHKVHSGEGFEIWVTAEEDGTITIHHVYLAEGH